MSRTLAQKTNLDGFPKAGELIEITGTHELEAMDRAVLNVLYQHAHDSGRLADTDVVWELPMTALRPSKHESNDRLRDALDRLMRVIVNVPYREKDGEDRLLKTHLFDFFDLSVNQASPSATVRFGLPRQLQPILARSGHWGRIRAEVVCSMTSKYAIALYELIQLRAKLTEKTVETFPVDRLRDLLGVPPGTYQRGNDFARKVIEPAELEVNGLTDMGVKLEVRRAKGPRSPIVAIAVAWWPKEGEEYREAVRERLKSKVGRMTRLRGRVERVV